MAGWPGKLKDEFGAAHIYALHLYTEPKVPSLTCGLRNVHAVKSDTLARCKSVRKCKGLQTGKSRCEAVETILVNCARTADPERLWTLFVGDSSHPWGEDPEKFLESSRRSGGEASFVRRKGLGSACAPGTVMKGTDMMGMHARVGAARSSQREYGHSTRPPRRHLRSGLPMDLARARALPACAEKEKSERTASVSQHVSQRAGGRRASTP
ncbi:hypothetical protein BV20DRAFT_508322 [Pilatotrama ljubarskyi]|nr:hypothetical protein BV20DRAFT_508322 [Pilatotrama ljubarskyi]